MGAAWYERRGPARQVLVVGELPDLQPGAAEVRIRLTHSGINPGDVGKRSGRGAPMPYPRVIPHSDGAGVIDAVGAGVADARLGQRVWCYGAQSYRPFGTAAQYVVVPDTTAVPLPSKGVDDQAACLGIAGITGYRALFADGSVHGLTVLVHGAAGGVGSIAVQMARRDGARVLATVRSAADVEWIRALGANEVLLVSDPDLAATLRSAAPEGVDRIAEIDFAGNIRLDAEILAVGGVVSSYFSVRPESGLAAVRPLLVGARAVICHRVRSARNPVLPRDVQARPSRGHRPGAGTRRRLRSTVVGCRTPLVSWPTETRLRGLPGREPCSL